MSIDLTLDRIRKLSSYLPTYTRPTCHIAGTNGKGSVCSLLSSILVASLHPLAVGRFNSPHLISVNDSITIGNEPVNDHEYAATRAEIEKVDRDHAVGASPFEVLTLTALLLFERADLDLVVIEVGMGGRLDATNVIPDECILVSALTAVDLDHQAFLGSTVVAIAGEKAAIARKGKPFILGPQKYPDVREIVQRVVHGIGGRLLQASIAVQREWDEATDGPKPPVFSFTPFRPPPPKPVRLDMPCFPDSVSALLPLYGDHQLENLGLAASVVSVLLTHPSCIQMLSPDIRGRITPISITQGIKATNWRGRLSFHHLNIVPSAQGNTGRPLILLADGAHNPASSATLSAYISDLFSLLMYNEPADQAPRSVTYVLALSHSPPKTPFQTLSPLLAPPPGCTNVRVAVLGFTPPEGMPWVHSVPPSELQRVVRNLMPNADVWSAEDDEDAHSRQLLRALTWASKMQGSEEGLVVLAGSLYLVADLYRLINEGVVSV
jgi:folylpolyglutamate synthase